jgi:hypothetical protein
VQLRLWVFKTLEERRVALWQRHNGKWQKSIKAESCFRMVQRIDNQFQSGDSRADAAKRQVDTRTAWTGFFFDPMLPIALGLALHQEKTAGRKFQADRL